MPLWPFRRRSDSRKRTLSGAALSDFDAPQKSYTQPSSSMQRGVSQKKQRTEPIDMSRRQSRQTGGSRERTYSFSPGRNDKIGTDSSRKPMREQKRRNNDGSETVPADSGWSRTPTLHKSKRGRKSIRMKQEDHTREAELKAMSKFMPSRPATEAWQSGRPMKKDSLRVKTGFGSQQASEISLPTPASIHSALSAETDIGSYKLSLFDSLAPRPTLRYAPGSRGTPSRASMPTRVGSEKKVSLAERSPIPEEDIQPRRRINELADNLDASDLRELMERDRRRKDRKQKSDRETSARNLAEKAEVQKNREAEAKQMGTPPPENLERGSVGREMIGLGIDPASVVVTSSRHRDSGTSESIRDAGDEEKREDTHITNPFTSIQDDQVSSEIFEPYTEPEIVSAGALVKEEVTQAPTPEPEEHVPSLPSTSKFSHILSSKKSRSRSTLNSDREKAISPAPHIIDEEDEGLLKDSESSHRGPRFSFTSFLRRGGRSRRGSTGPASFSNASREEMQAAAASSQTGFHSVPYAQAVALAKLQGDDTPASPPPESRPVYLVRKSSGDVPKRTRSRFREDLPDFSGSETAIGPEDNEPPIPPLPEQFAGGMRPMHVPSMPGHRSIEAMRQSPTPFDHGSDPSSNHHHSISLASIDSEGSWLSGAGGVSGRTPALRDTIVKSSGPQQNPFSNASANSVEDELVIADDESLSQLAPRNDSGFVTARRSKDDGRPSSDEDEMAPPIKDDVSMVDSNLGANWGSIQARHDDVQSHDQERIHSRHGLLNMSSDVDDEYEDEILNSTGSDDQSEASMEEVLVERAQSVELKRSHARTFSAGSAKLLDLPARNSVDAQGAEKRSPDLSQQ